MYQQSVVHPNKIVFDLGGVLLDWRPQVTVAQLAASISIPSAQTDVLFRCIFQDYGRHADWVQFDQGLISIEDISQRIADRINRSFPMLSGRQTSTARFSEIKLWIQTVGRELQPISGTVDLLHELSAEGIPLFFLSNMPKQFALEISKFRSIFDHFADGIFSSDVKLVKPDRDLFYLADERFSRVNCEKNCKQSKRTIFIDDSLENLKSAETLGWFCIHFTSPEQLKHELMSKLQPKSSAFRP